MLEDCGWGQDVGMRRTADPTSLVGWKATHMHVLQLHTNVVLWQNKLDKLNIQNTQ